MCCDVPNQIRRDKDTKSFSICKSEYYTASYLAYCPKPLTFRSDTPLLLHGFTPYYPAISNSTTLLLETLTPWKYKKWCRWLHSTLICSSSYWGTTTFRAVQPLPSSLLFVGETTSLFNHHMYISFLQYFIPNLYSSAPILPSSFLSRPTSPTLQQHQLHNNFV